jgi:RNA polymerase sigma-70 factor (ECF subfamily)
MVATLTRTLGAAHLEVAEEVVQDALLRALQLWPHEGVPAHPEGWLYRVARNLALDRARRTATLAGKLDLLATEIPGVGMLAEPALDDELVLIFLCCHPALTPESQIALVLKTAGGFSVDEIAAALLARPSAIAQRVVRAKETLRAASAEAELPPDHELPARLDAVLRAIYLLFNEGYSAHVGETVVRAELCREAIRLAELLATYQATDRPDVHALVSLLCFQASRLPARADDAGALLLLSAQDRTKWDRALIARGFRALERASAGETLTTYHLEAGIAAAHAAAATFAVTDWRGILDLYDRLVALHPSPVAALNRAVAVAEVHGPAAALEVLAPLADAPQLMNYYLLPATRAAMLERLGRRAAAAGEYARALDQAGTAQERRWIEGRIEELDAEGRKRDSPTRTAPPDTTG